LDALVVGEGPQRGPELEQVARQSACALVARRLAGVGAQQRLELATQRPDAALELVALAGVLEDLPGPEQLLADLQGGLAELLVGGQALGVRFEVAPQVRP